MSRIKTAKKSDAQSIQNKDDLSKYDPLVFAIARKYGSFFPYMEFDELVAEGRLGLFEASLKYKNDKNTAFSTYAWFWVIKNMQNYISKNVNIIETPQNVKNTLSEIKKIIDENTKSGKNISLEKIAKILGINVSEVSDALAMSRNVSNAVSLDKEVDSGEHTRYFVDSVEDKSQPEIFDTIVQNADSEMLSEMISKLSEKEKAVLSFRFALGGCAGKKMSIKDIAEELDISVSKVKDLENSALLKLKGMIKDTNE
ncbi:MAG: sigma-70 family RNA polymerase sigma factor [Endomicrobia bacterium]|nr:sigma-70 family RNA polymerase sigma factor [Endomicrobiia bacterium]MCL2145127.1 sigma-70 family RNA polymerase sigma factor [Endomicrobiia bacterium]